MSEGYSSRRWPSIPASSFILDSKLGKLGSNDLDKMQLKRQKLKDDMANLSKLVRPWSALSKDSSVSYPPCPFSPTNQRSKTAAGRNHYLHDRDSCCKHPSPGPRLAKPQLKVQSRLRNGHPRGFETRGKRLECEDVLTQMHVRHRGCNEPGVAVTADKVKVKVKKWAATDISESTCQSTANSESEGGPVVGGTGTPGTAPTGSTSSGRSSTSRGSRNSSRVSAPGAAGACAEEADERTRSLKKPQPELPKWMTSADTELTSDDYDTDLEDDFPPPAGLPYDSTGKYVYDAECKSQGVVPASFLVRNLGAGNLRMRHHYLGGSGTKPLAEALRVNTVCEEIDLSDNYIEGSGAAAIAGVLKDNLFIVNLNISNNFIRTKGADAFCDALESNTTLKTLSLKGNQMSDTDAEKIGLALHHNMSLNCLDLSYNCFGEIGGQHLGAGLAANIGLADLDLSWNCLSGKGGVAICKAIAKNTILEILDLSWNGISNSGAAALGATLKCNVHLKVIDISNNRIGKDGAIKLAQGIAKNMGLETLLMGMNPIGEEGLEAMLKAIVKNTGLKLVGLEDIAISKTLQDRIKELTDSRDILIMSSAGSPQQSRINQTILAVFERFISENADRMEDLFNQMDKDKSGDITLEEFKYGLKDFGLRLTSKQLDSLLDELDADKSGTIELENVYHHYPSVKRASGRF